MLDVAALIKTAVAVKGVVVSLAVQEAAWQGFQRCAASAYDRCVPKKQQRDLQRCAARAHDRCFPKKHQ